MTEEEFERAKKAWEEYYAMKKGADYTTNYCKSLGYKGNSDAYPEERVNLETRELLGEWNVVNQDVSNAYTRSLLVSGAMATQQLDLCDEHGMSNIKMTQENAESLKVENDGKTIILKPKATSDYADKLTQTQMNEYNVVASKGDLDALKNAVSLDKDQMIAFLEILKYVPEMSSKVQQIENLIVSLGG